MVSVHRIVLDILKPYDPDILTVADELASLAGVAGVNATLLELDQEVVNIKVTLEGDLEYEAIRDAVEDLGGTIHSIDEVACGERLVENSRTPQD